MTGFNRVLVRMGEIQSRFHTQQTSTRSSQEINEGQFAAALKQLQQDKTHGDSEEKIYAPMIETLAVQYGVEPDLVKAVARAESNFNPRAISRAGAKGIMQLMPQTAKNLGVNNIFDPKENIVGGIKYLHQMLKQFDGDVSLALAAYNAGPGNVEHYQGIPPFKETQNYVKKVLSYYET